MQWDEEKLKETEKFRGTFEKIDEPKTPYRANSSVFFHLLRAMKKKNQKKKAKSKLSSINRSTEQK